jgi:hypothetical protein
MMMNDRTKLNGRHEPAHNLSFAVLVVAYVLVCAATPAGHVAPVLGSRVAANVRQDVIGFTGSIRGAAIKFLKRSRPSPASAGFAAEPVYSVRAAEATDASFRGPLSTAVPVQARLGTGALTARFLALS